jgi:hypothetical protein
MAGSSHGTHVASIEAGNRGICRKALLAGVLISLPDDDNDRWKSFSRLYPHIQLTICSSLLVNLKFQFLSTSVWGPMGTRLWSHFDERASFSATLAFQV